MNDDIAKSNYLTDLAARIRVSHEAVRHALRSAVERAMTTGDLLLEAKEKLQHGQWSQWIQEHCEISDRSARLYMRLAKNRAVIEAAGDVAGLTLNTAVRLLASPKDDAEKGDDKLEEAAAIIKLKWAEAKSHGAELRKRLIEAKAEMGEKKFKAFLQKEFPEPTDPKEKEFAELMGEIMMEIAADEDR
jgi:hypothetical protein